MIASLYQSGSDAKIRLRCLFGFSVMVVDAKLKARNPRVQQWFPSSEVVDILLSAEPTPQPEDVGRTHGGIELDVIPLRAPEKPRSAEEIVRLEGVLGVDAEGVQVQMNEAALHVVRVEIHDD